MSKTAPNTPPSALLNIELVPTSRLVPNARNARTHSKKQIEQIATSIRKFGFTVPILVDEKYVILAGHGRLQAAQVAGIEEVPVLSIGHLSDAKKRAYALADNRIALEAGWDRELLAVELMELTDLLKIEDLDISITAFASPEIDALFADLAPVQISPEDQVPALPRRAGSRLGDVWQLGHHRLVCGDSRNLDSFTHLMAGARAAAVFTDPPYNVRIASVVGRGDTKHREFVCASGDLSPAQFREFLKATLGNGVAHCTPGAVQFVCMDWRGYPTLCGVAEELFEKQLNLVVWNKTNAGQGSFYRSQHELIGVFRVTGASHCNNVELGKHGRNRSNVWTYAGLNTFGRGRMKALTSHPTVKPIGLVADALLDCTSRGDIVLDQFAGSGTTILGAEKVGRRCFAIEFDACYVDCAISRWQDATKLEATLLGDDRTFDEVRAERFASQDPSGGRNG